ncbi:MAG: PepSY domain-containing protein [Nevskiaceae bacterium]
MRFRRFLRQFHRWVGLLVGAQVLLWVLGGFIMSVLQLDAVHGDPERARVSPVALDPAAPRVPLGNLLADPRFAGATAATLQAWHGRVVYRIERPSGVQLVNAADGRLLSPLDEAAARAVAATEYAGIGAIAVVEWVAVAEGGAPEYRGRELPLWRVRFADARDTTLYISPQTGAVVARRNDLWRAFDFVWMLHIMDYEEREDFNHPLLITTAGTALLFVISGGFMLFFSFRRRHA